MRKKEAKLMWDKRPIGEQVNSGLLITAKILLVTITGGALAGGLAVLRNPQNTVPGSTFDRYPFLPWACVITATAILIPTVKRWVTILPGILGYGTLGGLIMLFSGHYGKMQVPRPVALGLTLFTIASSNLTRSFTNRDLTPIDRIALIGFVYCLAFSMTQEVFTMFVALGIGLALPLVAWGVDRYQQYKEDCEFRRRHGRAARGSSPPPGNQVTGNVSRPS